MRLSIYILLIIACSRAIAQEGSLVVNWSQSQQIDLKWYTSDLINYEGVNVFRKANGSDWIQINNQLIKANRYAESSANDEIEFVNSFVNKKKSLEGIMKLNTMLASFKYAEVAQTMGIYFLDTDSPTGLVQYQVKTTSGKLIASKEVDLSTPFIVEQPKGFGVDQKRKKLKMFWASDPMQFYAVNVYAVVNGKDSLLNNYPIMGSDQSEYDSTERFQYEVTLTENTNYEFYIKSIGFFNNESSESERIKISLGDITAPSVPKGLNYSQKGTSTVHLSWAPYTDTDASELVLFRGLNYDDLEELAGIPVSDLKFTDVADITGDVYYAIGARDKSGNVAISERIIVHVEDMVSPASPSNLSAVSDSGRVDLTWTSVPDRDLSGYLLFRSGGAGKDFKLMNADPITETNYTFKSSMRSRSPVRFFVISVDSALNRSDALDTVTIVMKDYISPAKPLIKNIEIVNGSMTLLWMPNTETDLKEYQVFRKEVKDTLAFEKVGIVDKSQSRFVDSTCVSLVKYQYCIKAVDDSENISGKSNVFTINAPYQNTAVDAAFQVKWKYKKKKQTLALKWKDQNTMGYTLFEIKGEKKQRQTGMMKETKFTIFEVEKGSEYMVVGYKQDGSKYSSQVITIQ